MKDGNDMLEHCRPFFNDISGIPTPGLTTPQKLDLGYCAGYLQGVLDVNEAWKIVEGRRSRAVQYCFPSAGVPNGQVLRIIKKGLDDNPDKLHKQPSVIIHAALVQAFPCK